MVLVEVVVVVTLGSSGGVVVVVVTVGCSSGSSGDICSISSSGWLVLVLGSILLIQYNRINRKIVRRMVESRANVAIFAGCSILEADDGRTALDVMRSEMAAGRVIHLVLMDFIMVHMNGPEAVQKMREEIGYDGIVVGITGNALPDDLTYFKDHGANTVITKPVTNAKLLDAISVNSKAIGSSEQGTIILLLSVQLTVFV